MTLNDILHTAIDIARGAGEILRSAGDDRLADFKTSENDLVTEYDRRSEAFIVERLKAAFPGHALRAEEGTRINQGAEYEWLIDPIDGTTNFAHSLPFYAVVLGLLQAGQPVVGVVYDPTRDELFTGIKGGGSFLNGRRLKVSSHAPLARALLVTGFPYDVRTNPDNNIARYSQFALRSRGVRRLGSAALELSYVASGRVDGYWESRLKPWDVAAGIVIAREAGATVSDYSGRELPLPHDEMLATNGLIHPEMLTVMRDGDSAPRPA